MMDVQAQTIVAERHYKMIMDVYKLTIALVHQKIRLIPLNRDQPYIV